MRNWPRQEQRQFNILIAIVESMGTGYAPINPNILLPTIKAAVKIKFRYLDSK